MTAAEGSFVDLSYRGLALARRVKLTQVRPGTGYVEMPAPMPVGTQIAIATDDGVQIDAVVAEIHEQVAGASQTPGMLVQPTLAGAAAEWWKAHVELPAEPPPEDLRPRGSGAASAGPAGTTDPTVRTTIVGRRMAGDTGVPELIDDGRNTAVMDAVDPDAAPQRDSEPIIDDGKRTTMMDAVDLAALGLDPAASSGSMPAATDDDDNGNGDKPGAKPKKKKKKR